MTKIEDLGVLLWVVSAAVGIGVTVIGGLLIWAIKSLISSIISLRIEVAELKAVMPTVTKTVEKMEKDLNKAYQRIIKIENNKTENKGVDI